MSRGGDRPPDAFSMLAGDAGARCRQRRPGPADVAIASFVHAGRVAGTRAGTMVAVAILVDTPIWPWRGRMWAHLVSDIGYDELHGFAERLGLPRRAFQGDHYDVDETLRGEAIALGAEPVSPRELLHRLRRAGLRRPRSERPARP